LIKQGAKLVATWEDVWKDLPSQVRLELEAEVPAASKPEAGASLLPDPVLRPQEAMELEVPCTDSSLQIDEVLDLLEMQLTSSEVFYGSFRIGDGGPPAAVAGRELRADALKAGTEGRPSGSIGPGQVAEFRFSPSHQNGPPVTIRMRYISMQRNGFAEVCGLGSGFFVRGTGTAVEEKSFLPVEMRWCSVVGCNTCG